MKHTFAWQAGGRNRAVDSEGNTIDFMLSPKRDLTAAKLEPLTQLQDADQKSAKEASPKVCISEGPVFFAQWI
jgi:hypothetical protein